MIKIVYEQNNGDNICELASLRDCEFQETLDHIIDLVQENCKDLSFHKNYYQVDHWHKLKKNVELAICVYELNSSLEAEKEINNDYDLPFPE